MLLQYTQLKWLNDYEGSTIPKFLDASVPAGLAMSASSATNIAKFDIDAMDSDHCLEESPSPNITPLSPRLLQGQTVTALCKNLTRHFPTVWSISEPIQTQPYGWFGLSMLYGCIRLVILNIFSDVLDYLELNIIFGQNQFLKRIAL